MAPFGKSHFESFQSIIIRSVRPSSMSALRWVCGNVAMVLICRWTPAWPMPLVSVPFRSPPTPCCPSHMQLSAHLSAIQAIFTAAMPIRESACCLWTAINERRENAQGVLTASLVCRGADQAGSEPAGAVQGDGYSPRQSAAQDSRLDSLAASTSSYDHGAICSWFQDASRDESCLHAILGQPSAAQCLAQQQKGGLAW